MTTKKAAKKSEAENGETSFCHHFEPLDASIEAICNFVDSIEDHLTDEDFRKVSFPVSSSTKSRILGEDLRQIASRYSTFPPFGGGYALIRIQDFREDFQIRIEKEHNRLVEAELKKIIGDIFRAHGKAEPIIL